MEFNLIYRGPLKSGKTDRPRRLQELRRKFHPQLRELWQQEPLQDHRKYLDRNYEPDDCFLIEEVGPFEFAPLVSKRLNLVVELDVLFLRPEPPGSLAAHGGDLDNRIKTLLDALRMPSAGELPTGDAPKTDEEPFFCLLQDDALVTKLSIRADRLLDNPSPGEAMLVIHVSVKATRLTFANIGLAS